MTSYLPIHSNYIWVYIFYLSEISAIIGRETQIFRTPPSITMCCTINTFKKYVSVELESGTVKQ